MKSLKIRHLLMILVVVAIAVSVTIIAIISILASSDSIKADASEKLELISINKGQDLERTIHAAEQQATTLANLITDHLLDNRISASQPWSEKNVDLQELNEHLDPVMFSFASSINDLEPNLYYRLNFEIFKPEDPEHEYLLYTYKKDIKSYVRIKGIDQQVKSNANRADFPWYYEPMEEHKALWLGPYMDQDLKEEYVSYVVPLYENNTFLGVVGVDLSFTDMVTMLNEVRIYETGYAVLTNEKYDFLIHPLFTPEDNLRTVDNGGLAFMVNELQRAPSGSIEYKFRGDDKLLGYSTLSNGWVLATAPVESEILASIQTMTKRIVWTTVLCILIGSTFAYFIGGQIAMPIETLTAFFNRVSTFDLTYDKSTLWLTSYKNEIGDLANAIYKITIDQHKFIKSIQTTSKDLNEHTESTFAKMVDVQELADDQSFSLRELKKAIEDIAESTDATDAQAERLSTDIGEIHQQLTRLTDSLSSQIDMISKDSTELNLKLDILTDNIETLKDQPAAEINNRLNEGSGLFEPNACTTDDIQLINDHLLKFIDQSKHIQKMIWDLRESYDQLNNYAQSIFVSVEQQTANIEEVLATADSIADMAVVIAQSSLTVRSETERLRNKSTALDRIVSKFKLGTPEDVSEVAFDDEL